MEEAEVYDLLEQIVPYHDKDCVNMSCLCLLEGKGSRQGGVLLL